MNLKKVTKRLNKEHLTGMLNALKQVPNMEIKKDSTAAIVTYKNKHEVLRAIKMGNYDLWSITHVDNLFN